MIHLTTVSLLLLKGQNFKNYFKKFKGVLCEFQEQFFHLPGRKSLDRRILSKRGIIVPFPNNGRIKFVKLVILNQ
jgi:hypothetical protein